MPTLKSWDTHEPTSCQPQEARIHMKPCHENPRIEHLPQESGIYSNDSRLVRQSVFNIFYSIKIGLEILNLRFPSHFSYCSKTFIPVSFLSKLNRVDFMDVWYFFYFFISCFQDLVIQYKQNHGVAFFRQPGQLHRSDIH